MRHRERPLACSIWALLLFLYRRFKACGHKKGNSEFIALPYLDGGEGEAEEIPLAFSATGFQQSLERALGRRAFFPGGPAGRRQLGLAGAAQVLPLFIPLACRIDLEAWEHVTCMKTVSLKSEETVSGLKGYIAVGTCLMQGEEVTCRGRVSGTVGCLGKGCPAAILRSFSAHPQRVQVPCLAKQHLCHDPSPWPGV